MPAKSDVTVKRRFMAVNHDCGRFAGNSGFVRLFRGDSAALLIECRQNSTRC
jgi:hypothetical protein